MTASADEMFISPLSQRPQAHSSPHDTQHAAAAAAHIPSHSSSTKLQPCYAYDPPKKGDHWRTLVLNISIASLARQLPFIMLSYIKPDAVIITETKLNKNINTAEELPIDLGHTVYRKDRLNDGGGGVRGPVGKILLLFHQGYPHWWSQ